MSSIKWRRRLLGSRDERDQSQNASLEYVIWIIVLILHIAVSDVIDCAVVRCDRNLDSRGDNMVRFLGILLL